jgi:alkylation response protein AidB-like acyl-CoA dehydrogenase
MDFDLTREQEMIRKEVRKFADSVIAPIAADLDEKEMFSAELTRKMGEIGLFGMFVSETYDGQAMDYLSYIIAVEEIARVDGSQAATIAAGNSLGIGPLYYFGTEKQKQKYLPALCRGEGLWGFGLTEPTAGSDEAKLRRQGRRYLGDQRLENFYHQCRLRDDPGGDRTGHHRHPAKRQTGIYLLYRGKGNARL